MSKKVALRIADQSDVMAVMGKVLDLITRGLKGGPVVIWFGRDGRSNDQNSKLWPMLSDLSSQCDISGVKYDADDWKCFCMSSFLKQEGNEPRLAVGLEGEPVMLGYRTSKLSKARFSALIECIFSIGAIKGVRWSEKSLESYNQYREFSDAKA